MLHLSKMGLNQVFHELSGCRTAEALIDAAGKHMKNPLILADISLHILALTPDDDIPDPRWHDLFAERVMPENLVNLSLYRDALRTESPVLSTDSTGLPIVRCAVAQDGKLIAYLLSPCYHGAPTQVELDLLQLIADLAALRIRRAQYMGDITEDGPDRFLIELLDGGLTDEQLIRDRCRTFGWKISVPYYIVSVRGANPTEMEHGEGYLKQTNRCKQLQRLFPGSIVFLYGEQIKLIIGTEDDIVRGRIVFDDLSSFLHLNERIAGVSQPGRALGTVSERHLQAMKALQLGALLMGSGPLYYYDRYSIYHALELCAERLDLLELCHPAVLTLERYDRTHNTSYMGTLHAYLASGMNARETAKTLYIHRNTLSKRLEKLHDLITVDLSDRETVFHLLFSLRVIEYYGATRMRKTFEGWIRRMPTLRHT